MGIVGAYAGVLVDAAAGPGSATRDWRLDPGRERKTVFMRLRYLEKPSGLSSPGWLAVSCGDMSTWNWNLDTIGEWRKNAMANARSQVDVDVD